MGRPRKSKAEHELNGTFTKHPERAAAYANEPKPDGPLGPPPALMLKEYSSSAAHELTAWNELIVMAPPGVLTSADRWWCERAARLMAKSRYSRLTGTEESTLKDYMAKMACNPADRSKVSVLPGGSTHAPTAKSNRFTRLAAQVPGKAAGQRPN